MRRTPSGFGAPTLSKWQLINQTERFLPQKLNATSIEQIVNLHRRDWNAEYPYRDVNFSLEELLAMETKDRELSFEDRADLKYIRMNYSHKNLSLKEMGWNGVWGINISLDTKCRVFDFSITAACASYNNFHPYQIENQITSKYGEVIYQEYKARLIDEIPKLKILVEEAQKRIDYVAPSVTCCHRSARLCERVGIPVKKGMAYLLPYKYQD